tara:strand:+ start:1040 stop:1561 length:522 start_codon:yes stop_codon:yes gene_type:complete
MKLFKKILLIILALMVAFFLFLIWYQHNYSMDVVSPYTINSPTLEKKLLIATQGSEFKNKVTSGIVNHFKTDSVYIEIVDVESLNVIDPNDFNALVIIHTWENWKPPLSVQTFIEKYRNESNKIVVLTTSGDGNYTMEGIDAIAGESKISDAPLFINKIIERLNKLLVQIEGK